ncbi:MAG: PIN domain-containing protein [Acidimicrobiales bacterium]
MNDDRVFIDTNILVYSYDADAGQKHDMARSLLKDLWVSRTGALSTQVLQEFYVTVTRKMTRPLNRLAAREIVDTYRAWPVQRPDVDDVIAASELEEHHQLSFWDALVIVSAQRSGARTLFSEDLQDGQRFGELTITNPFASAQGDS